ncbi:MAG: protein kinase [Rudaea sp.]
MDWLRILATLTPQQRVALDLPKAWLRFRTEGGADDADAFRAWLVARHPERFTTAQATLAPGDRIPPRASAVAREPERGAAEHAPAPAQNEATPIPVTQRFAQTSSAHPADRPELTLAASHGVAEPQPIAADAEPAVQSVAGGADERERARASSPADDALQTIALGGGATSEETIALTGAAAPAARRPMPTNSDLDPIEVSHVLPARFALPDDAQRTLADHEAATIVSPRHAAQTVAGRDHISIDDIESDTQRAVIAAAAAADAAARFHYDLIGTAGEGGMGTVHIAKDTELLRRVALKQLSAKAEGIASARTRFLREAQITAQLDHPNIVPVHALEVAPGGAPAYTMKLVEGRDFHGLLGAARAAFDGGRPDETIALAARIEHFLKVCDAIAYAHDKGVIHRDLKPANLMLGRHNEVYVMDWGLCRTLHEAADDSSSERSQVISSADVSGGASDTQLGDIVGTPKYMSPEQAQGRNHELDTRSDQCALGLILYELATLNPPYFGKTASEVLANAAAGRRRPLVHAFLGKRGVPRDLGAIIDRATARMPAQRYASVAELAADVRRYLRGDPVVAHRDTLWQRTQREVGRNRQRVLVGGLALIAASAIAIGVLLWRNQQVVAAERVREQRLLQLRDAVAAVSSDVQVRLVQLESAVENLADSVAQIGDFGREVATRVYLQRDFRDPASAPPDLVANRILGGRISLGWPVWSLPPGMSESAAQPTLRRLAALQPFHRDIYHRAAVMIRNRLVDIYAPATESGSDDAENSPLAAIVLGLPDGISARYPGWDGLPDGYDPRKQPWYQLAEGKRSPQWGDPYRSAETKRIELALSVPMVDRDSRFGGVVSALLFPDGMVESLLDIHGVAGLRDVFLVDAGGHVLASLRHTLDPPASDTSAPAIVTFPVPEVLRRQPQRQTGILETTLRGEAVVLAYDEVEPLGWFVIALAAADGSDAAATAR